MKVLFFAPHSAIWIHAFPEALVAEALAQEGNEIVYVGCGGLLHSHCISMTALGVPFEATRYEKERICRLCRHNKEIIRTRFKLGGVDLAETANDEDVRVAATLGSSVTPQNCLDLVVDGVEVGRIALYELLIQHKKADISFSAGEWQRYQAGLRNAIVVLRVMQRVFLSAQPDRVVQVYNASLHLQIVRRVQVGRNQWHSAIFLARGRQSIESSKNADSRSRPCVRVLPAPA